MANLEFIVRYDTGLAGPYAMSKGALNVAVVKFAAEHRDERILFMAISPGVGDTHLLPSRKTPKPLWSNEKSWLLRCLSST
ncbi:hypothetical protein F5Y06DRAFT_257305 [Hypoxylon sp. FL0890]|nr:hypothetical protein F5Y06DRAFT_257305 [Hypoxylon sp. FL0890]